MIATIRALIAAAALAHGVSQPFMDSLARCESTYNPFAINGPNEGLYQLSRYGKQAEFHARGYDNVWDPAQQANYVAEKVAEGDVWAWTCARLVPRPISFRSTTE